MSGTLVSSNLPCPVCEGNGCGTIYRNNANKPGDEDFYMYVCFSSKHDVVPFSKPVNSPETYVEDLTNGTKTSEDFKPPVKAETPMGLVPEGEFMALDNPDHPWGYRGLTEDTCRKFGVYVKTWPFTRSPSVKQYVEAGGFPIEQPCVVFPNWDEAAKGVIGQKVRSANPRSNERTYDWYKTREDFKANKTFFGQNLWVHDRWKTHKIVITFGEFDAMAFYQMIPGYPVVSVPDGDTSAKEMIERHYGWLNRFSEIVFIPDNDENGGCLKIVQALAAKFPRKAKIVNLTKHKDVCDYLIHKDFQNFREAFFAAQAFTPQKIIGLSALRKELHEEPPKPIADYPWAGLNALTGGIWAGELITIKAPPKIGKSSCLSEIAYHLHQTTDAKVGIIYLEETKRDFVFRMVGRHIGKNLQRDYASKNISAKELDDALDQLTQPEKFFILEHWGACSSDFLEEKITEFVRSIGCQFILFDHVSMAITDESNKDERIALDRLISAIKSLTVGIPDIDDNGKTILRQPTIFMVTHVNDNGQPRGSRAALQISNLVLGLERNKMSDNPLERNILTIKVEENRRYGDTGTACKLKYDKDTGRLEELPFEDGPVFDNTHMAKQTGYVYKGDKPL